jgi:hypothetical protein
MQIQGVLKGHVDTGCTEGTCRYRVYHLENICEVEERRVGTRRCKRKSLREEGGRVEGKEGEGGWASIANFIRC